MRPCKEYIVYDSFTDMPICIGSIKECASIVGSTPSSLKSAMSKYLNGDRDNCRYLLYDLDKLIAGGYLEEGDESGELCED